MGGCPGVCVFVCVGCGVGSEINLALGRGGGGGCPSGVCLSVSCPGGYVRGVYYPN